VTKEYLEQAQHHFQRIQLAEHRKNFKAFANTKKFRIIRIYSNRNVVESKRAQEDKASVSTILRLGFISE